MTNILRCQCGATAKDTSKERRRFRRRHFENCQRTRRDARLKASVTANNVSMDDDAPEVSELRVRS